MKKLLLILMLLLAGVLCLAQEKNEFRVPDSLIVEMNRNSKPDMNRVEALANIIDYCNKNRQYQKAQPYIDDLTQISEKLDNEYVKALSDFYQGTISLNKNDYKEALLYLDKGLNTVSFLPENEKTIRLHARLLNSFGALYCDMRMYAEGFACFSKGLEFCKNINDAYLTSLLEINTANILNQMGRHEETIELCKKNLAHTTDLAISKHIIYLILAESYRQKSPYDITLKYYDSAFSTSATRHDESRCLTNKALLYYNIEDYENSRQTFRFVLDNYRDEMFKDAEILAMGYYGFVLGLESKSDSAMNYIDSAIIKAREYNFPSLEMECYASKSKLQYKYGEFEGFSETIMKYLALRDSLDVIGDQQRLEKAWLSNEFKKTEEQLRLEKELSDVKNGRAKVRLYMVIFGLGSIVVILALAFNRRNMLIKNKNIQLKNNELKEEMLTKEIEMRNRELTAKALVQAQRQELLAEMTSKLKAIVDDKRKLSQNLNEVISDMEKYKTSNTPEDFDYYFTQTNPDFYKHLLADFPNLTTYEQRLCAFLKLNLSTKDIAAISNISIDSARVARTRLRKSLKLTDTDKDLVVFLSKY